MKLKLFNQNDRYSFRVVDGNNLLFDSSIQYFLCPFLKSSYSTVWQAIKDGRKLINHYSYHCCSTMFKFAREDLTEPVVVDISAEDMLINHYYNVYSDMIQKIRGLKRYKDPKYKDKVQKECEMIIKELGQIKSKLTDPMGKKDISKYISKFIGLQKKHFKEKSIKKAGIIKTDDIGCEEKEELIEDYAGKICQAIQNIHDDCYYKIDDNNISILSYKDKEPILRISVGDNLNIGTILPAGKTSDIYPLHSSKFYQHYWKPIVKALGHFCLDDNILMVFGEQELPDVENKRSESVIKAWNIKDKKETTIVLSLKDKEDLWTLQDESLTKTASYVSKYNEYDYKNAIVKCIDPQLKSLYNRTGVVIEVIPRTDNIEIDVDFGRGLDVVRLVEQQIEIVII